MQTINNLEEISHDVQKYRLLNRMFMLNRNKVSYITDEGQVIQDITRVINLVTKDSALYNVGLPKNGRISDDKIQDYINVSKEDCPFCRPICLMHDFGKIESAHSFTSPNPRAYDHLSGIVIFNKHDPLDQNEEEVVDHFETAFELIRRLQQKTKGVSYPQIIWNCMPKAGTNIVHGHMQVLVAQVMPYSDVLNWTSNAVKYKVEFDSDYLHDLRSVHDNVGLSVGNAFVSLTPKKEIELVLVGEDKDIGSFATELYNNLDALIHSCNVRSFNMTCYPIRITGKDYMVARIVDRGDPLNEFDVAGMDIFGETVVRTDPYNTKKSLEDYFAIN